MFLSISCEVVLLFTEPKLNSSFFRKDSELRNCRNMSKKGTIAGLSESFEVDREVYFII